MSWPLAIGSLLACGAAWLLLRPALAALPERQRGLAAAGLLGVAAVALFALRMAPLGVIALVLGGGAALRALNGERLAAGLSEDAPRKSASGMSEAEALSILGLSAGADAAAVEAAHRRMIVRAHPDAGGSDYLAAKVNEARSVLLG